MLYSRFTRTDESVAVLQAVARGRPSLEFLEKMTSFILDLKPKIKYFKSGLVVKTCFLNNFSFSSCVSLPSHLEVGVAHLEAFA